MKRGITVFLYNHFKIEYKKYLFGKGALLLLLSGKRGRIGGSDAVRARDFAGDGIV